MNESDFDRMLRSAGAMPPLAPNFRTAVWRKIEAQTTTLPRWRSWIETCLELCSRPSVATAGVVAMIVVGGSLGLTGKPDPGELENRYLRSVSPFVQTSRP